MAKGSPTMIALLGMLAVAGYQNRDKLGEMLGSALGAGAGAGADPNSGTAAGAQGQAGGLLDSLREMANDLTGGQSEKALAGLGLGGATAGKDLQAGLSEIFGRFSGPDQQAKAQSWVGTGPNETLAAHDLEKVLDGDTIAELLEKTGLNRNDLLSRLSQILPDAIDSVTPDGKLPDWFAQGPRPV